MTLSRVIAAGAAAGAVLTLCGCSSSSPPDAGTSSAAVSAPSSAAPTTSDPTEEAEAQAQALVSAYIETIDGLYLDPSRSLEDVYTVAVTPEATAEATAIQAFRSRGDIQLGRSQVVSTSVGQVDLTSERDAQPTPVLPSVVVNVCVDVSQVQATDANGASVVPADRLPYLIEELTVVNIDYPDAFSWRVSSAPNRQASACDG